MSIFIPPLARSSPASASTQGAATWEFYAAGTLDPSAVFADAGRKVSVGSSIRSDTTGRFPTTYLSQDLAYRAILKDAAGRTLQDIDPVDPLVGLIELASPHGAALVGYAARDGSPPRTVQDKLRETVSPEDFGAGRGDADQDTQAFKAMVALDLHIKLTPGKSYFLNDDVTAAHPSKDGFRVMIEGTPGETQGRRPRIIVTKPGVTPFPVATDSYIEGVAIEYQQQAKTPLVGGDSWTFARAFVVASASIATVRGKLTLTVAAGGLVGNVTRGSVVVILADRGRTESHWANNYDSFDSIFQIDAVVDDRTATLQGKADTRVTNAPMHIRGCPMSVIWMRYQPNAISFRQNALGSIPGYAVASMGAQKLRVEGNTGLDLGAPHMGILFAGNGQGYYGDAGAGAGEGWTRAGIYHMCSLEQNMLFYACGGAAINGWVDGRIVQNQVDQNHSVNRALARFFPNFSAVYTLSNCHSCAIENNAAEDSPSPDGIKLFQCYELVVRNFHAHDLAQGSYALHFEGCGACGYEGVRNSGGVGDARKRVRFSGHGAGAPSEVLGLRGGRSGAGLHHYSSGAFGAFAPLLDRRDGSWRKFALTHAALKAHTQSTYDWVIPYADLAGSEGMDLFLIEDLILDHGTPWSSNQGGVPSLQAGARGRPTALLDAISLGAPEGQYMDARGFPARIGPIAFSPGALGRNSDLVLRIFSGGPLMNAGGFQCDDIALYLKIAGVRSEPGN